MTLGGSPLDDNFEEAKATLIEQFEILICSRACCGVGDIDTGPYAHVKPQQYKVGGLPRSSQ
jgi:hypothetical protein